MAVSPPSTSSSSVGRPLYEASTQYKNWRFSLHHLNEIRRNLNSAAVSVIRDAFERDEAGSSSNVSFLNADEELLLVKLYISKIPQLCAHFRFPEVVEATAISYLKRFYLKNTVMDWHPKNVMLTALFLATKTTNNPITLEAYASRIPKTEPSDVLDLEFLISQSLNFEFSVWHAHNALWGLWLDLQDTPEPAEGRTQEVYNKAVDYLHASRLTDVELIYTPSQIALACLSLVSPNLTSHWQQLKLKDQPDALSSLSSILPEIQTIIDTSGRIPEVDAVREVDRRLRLCKNPEKVVGSRAWLARKAEREKKAEAKRRRKAQMVEQAMNEGDPFGAQTGRNGVDEDDEDDDD